MGIVFPPTIDENEKQFITYVLKNVPDEQLKRIINARKSNVIIRHGLHENYADPIMHFNIMILDTENVISSIERHAHMAGTEDGYYWVTDFTPPLVF